MCDPVSIGYGITAVGVLASTAGSYANAKKTEAVTDKINQEKRAAEQRSLMAQQAERDRQLAFEREQMGLQQQVLHEDATPEKFEEKTEANTTDLSDQTADALDQVLMDRLPGQGANRTITEANARTINAGSQTMRQQLQAMAKLAAFDQSFADLGLALGASGQRIGSIGSKRAGSARVGQQEMQQVLPDVTPNRGMGPDLMIAFGQLAQSAGGAYGSMAGSPYGGAHSTANRVLTGGKGAPIFAPMPTPRPIGIYG